MLAVSGQLNNKAYGPPVPVMADLVGRFVIGQENNVGETPGAVIDMKGEQYRRSIYIQIRRSRPLSVFRTFDRPAMSPNCDKRRPSTGSPQSLLMMNSDLVLGYSRDLAERLENEAGADVNAQIQLAWSLVYSRAPEGPESAAAFSFIDQQTAIFAELPEYQAKDDKPPERTAIQEATALMCQMLLSSNEFLYVD